MSSPPSDISQSDLLDYWRNIYEDLKFCYERADEKSRGIITLSGILLGFITISILLSTSKDNSRQSIWLIYILFGFFVSVICSVVIAIWSLWARINFRIPHSNLDKQNHLPIIFFANIAEHYPIEKGRKNREEKSKEYFNDEIYNSNSSEILLKALATNITTISSNIRKKYLWINISYFLC